MLKVVGEKLNFYYLMFNSEYNLLTMEQVAQRLGVSLKTIYRWIESGQLPVSLVGRRTYRIFERDFVRFVYSRQINRHVNKKR
ncbi:MAG: helix-turn-helix domain-containing protein [Patescibacteria group bacterium]